MKIFNAAILFFLSLPLYAQDYAVLISPYQDKTSFQEQKIALLRFATALNVGDTVQFVDGYGLNVIGTFTVPERTTPVNVAARMNANRALGVALNQFEDQLKRKGGDGEPRTPYALRLPQALQALADRRRSDELLEVMAWGAAQYDVPGDGMSMVGAFIPGDGHLSHSRRDTPFGTAGQEKLLKSIRLHMLYTDALHEDRHSFYLERWWSLYVAAQSGVLVSFDQDATSMLERLKHHHVQPSQVFKREDTDKLEMLQLVPPLALETKPLLDRPLTSLPLSQSDSQYAQTVQVGITWNCTNCDLDLYAVAMPGASPVYFGRTDTREAQYWKDYRTSPDLSQGQETIAFKVPLDLRAVKLAVNFFGGHVSAGAKGEIRIGIGDQTYALPFHIPAQRGNGGKDVDAVLRSGKSSQATLLIDPLAIVPVKAARL